MRGRKITPYFSNEEDCFSQNSAVYEKSWFVWTILFLLFDYGRPQDILPIGSMRLGMMITLVLSFYVVSRGNFLQYKKKQIYLLFYFILLLSFHVPFSVNNYFAWMAFRDMFMFLPFVLSIIACVTTLHRLKNVVFTLLLLMAYVSLYSLTHGGVGSGSYFLDENDLSLYINMYLPFAFFLMLHDKRKKMKVFCCFLLVIGVAAVINSSSRGGFVGLIAIGFVIWIISDKKIISLFLIGVIGCIFYFCVEGAYFQEMSTIQDTDSGTALQRVESWKSSWRMFLDHPLGVGGHNFLFNFPEYQTDFFQRGMWGRAAHSLWFTLLPELGVPGVIVYFLIIYYNIRDVLLLNMISYKNKEVARYFRTLSSSVLASFAGFFASGTFISVLYYAHYWYMTAILVAMVNVANKLKKQETGAVQ